MLREAAGRLGVILVVGAPLRNQNEIYLASMIFFPSGLVDVYAKRRLGAFGPEAALHGIVPPPPRRPSSPRDVRTS